MKLRTFLKTMAVSIPMAVAPMKSYAQQVVKEVGQKASTEITARAGLEGNYNSFDHSTNVLAKVTYEFDRLFKKHK